MSCICVQHYPFVEIAVKQCRSCGIDCRIHGLSITGRYGPPLGGVDDDDVDGGDVAALFLASDTEDARDDERYTGTLRPVRRELRTNVFVWGLNDKEQLGGPKGSKVRYL